MIFSQADAITDALFRAAKGWANSQRKDDARKRLDYYHDDHQEHLKDDIRSRVNNPEKLTPLFVNITKKLINNLGTLYLEPPKRELNGTDKDKALFVELAESMSMNLKFKAANRYAKLLKTVMLRPVWRLGRLDLDLLTPDILDVWTDQSPQDVQAVMVTLYPESGDFQEVRYSVWTPEAVQTLDYRGRVEREEPNPYGILPFVPVWDGIPSDSFWLAGGADILSAQEAINRKLTDLLYVLDMQGFGVGYIKGGQTGEQELGPGVLIDLPENGEVGYVETKAPIESIIKAIEFIAKQAALANGLSASSLTTDPQEESGIARIVGNLELQEMRRDDAERFRVIERRLFEVARTVWNAHNPGRQLSEAATLAVDFQELKAPATPQEQAATWETLLALGVISEVDVLMERNPDIKTREEALQLLKNIRAEKGELQPQGENASRDFTAF